MLVRCPQCRTTFKISDELVRGSAATFRCSRCKHTFELEPADAAAQANGSADLTAPEKGDGQELSLPFQLETDSAAARPTETHAIVPPPTSDRFDERATNQEDGLVSSPARNDEPRLSFPEEGRRSEIERAVPRQELTPEDRYFVNPKGGGETEGGSNILALSSYLDQQASIVPFTTLLGLLVIGFTLMTAISYAKPQSAEAFLKKVPLFGTAMLRNHYLKDGILLRSLRSSYQTLQGNREVLLISGVALNQNPVVVREIQLTGIAYNETGKEIEKQTIWVGNTISPRILRGMTMEDIPHLQNLKPLKSFEIPPGDSVPFTIVFLKSAKSAKEFSCQVLAAGGAV
jgi:predicted Zn finger-like uncharacterized protein